MPILLAEMSATGTLLVVGAAVAVCILLVLADKVLLTPRVLLLPEDVVTAPGRPITLRVRLERDLLPFGDPPLRGVDVVFHEIDPSGRRPAGSAKTDPLGVASLSLPASPEAGRRRFAASVPARQEAGEAILIVDVLAPDTPVFVADIDFTVANVHPLFQGLRDNRRIPPVKGSPEALRAIASRFAVVFLSARDRIFRQKTLEWLRDNGFPETPVILRRRRVWSQKAADHKRERLSELASCVKLAVGVGDLRTDAAVYRERNMRAYLLGPGPDERAIAVPDWPTLLDDLVKAGLLPAASVPAPPSSSPSPA